MPFDNMLQLDPVIFYKILNSLIIIVLIWLIRTLIIRIVWRKHDNVQARYRWRKSTAYAGAVLGIFLVGSIWYTGFRSLSTYLGLLSAGLAIALKDIVEDLAG
ncbi:MAG: hypothetical protein A2Y62_01475 [Candidatus Fischerbacteria bacterium RBG_13_37_8]|uniref:Mechanosensitive ion channel protein MscS n=1 Tax=Candidatus Fischerbacteria bacterium RBG_13_37_8 TaxID=1817863 RepID=A0A1F5VU26_9BACT|nr:MAG: hypothetical protein A2Y62_01475 [Candidatus Fischerbacteria bacterium RBG_13_37_8]